jgi:hypothetical protein
MTATVEATAGWRMDERSLWRVCEEAQEARRTAYVRLVEMVAELWARSGRCKDDRVSLVAGLETRLRLAKREALQVVAHAELFASGAVREAARAGELDAERLSVLGKTLAAAPAPARDEVEAALLGQAHLDLHGFRTVARRILVLLDQDGPAPDDRELAEPKREFHYRSRTDGSVEFRGKIDPESGALLATLLSPLAKPTSGEDQRSTPQRQGDAFVEIIELAAGSEELPEEGGERPHLAVTMSLDALEKELGTALLDGMGHFDAAAARRIACDCAVTRVVLGANSEPLDIGRATRIVSNPIRRALIVRDGGCAFPGCHRRPRQCHAHHIVEWAKGGPTSLDNLVLLCGMHHRLIHHSGWTVTMTEGRPQFTAPDQSSPGRRRRGSTSLE